MFVFRQCIRGHVCVNIFIAFIIFGKVNLTQGCNLCESGLNMYMSSAYVFLFEEGAR